LTLLTAALCAAVVVVAGASAGRPREALLLPDLVQELPSDLQVRKAGDGWRLGFGSAVVNRGAGPLIIVGNRASTKRNAMSATQLIDRESGPRRRRPSVGALRYTREVSHQHWHLLRFDRYTLRRTGGREIVVADRKSGFCLGDRFDAELAEQLPGEPAQPPYTRNCGLLRPKLKTVTEGISVGYGDDYHAYLEGQYLEIGELPAGSYQLIHHVNAEKRMLEERYDNNVSCRGVELSWPNGRNAKPEISESKC
jgi:hypothetical protein